MAMMMVVVIIMGREEEDGDGDDDGHLQPEVQQPLLQHHLHQGRSQSPSCAAPSANPEHTSIGFQSQFRFFWKRSEIISLILLFLLFVMLNSFF